MVTEENARLLAIVGPTGSGKTELAIAIALAEGGEIVNADSRQLYRGMAIGTAQPDEEQLARAPHHLFATAPPDRPLNVTEYRDLAERTIGEIAQRGRLPILVGGSGLYVKSVVEGLAPPKVAPDYELRAALEAEIAEKGPEGLYGELATADPEAARSIDPRNSRRLVRALEVVRKSGRRFSEQGSFAPLERQVLKIGLTLDREALYRRVDSRVEEMVRRGLVDEVRLLMAAGYEEPLAAMTSVGYREIAAYIRGEMTFEGAVEKMKQRTHRFIRQQYTWFRLSDLEIRWLDAGDSETPGWAIALVEAWRQ